MIHIFRCIKKVQNLLLDFDVFLADAVKMLIKIKGILQLTNLKLEEVCRSRSRSRNRDLA